MKYEKKAGALGRTRTATPVKETDFEVIDIIR
jgi:hypothetical protein